MFLTQYSKPTFGLLDSILEAGLDSYKTRAFVKEEDSEYTFEIELAGFKKNEVSVYSENGTLSINAEQKNKKINKKRNRDILLPEDADESSISAKLEDGLLTIAVPKLKPKTKRIKVEV